VEVAASGFTKDLAAKFDEAAEELNILGGPDDPRVEDEDSDDSGDVSDEEDGEENEEDDVNEESEDANVANKSDTAGVDESGKGVGDQTDKSVNVKETAEQDKEIVEKIEKLDVDMDKASNDKCEAVDNIEDEKIDNEKANGDTDSESDDEDLCGQNRSLRPFRNEESLQHVNTHLIKSRARGSESICSMSTTSSIAPEVIRAKVKKQQKQQSDRLKARRIRKSGEASMQTKQRRDTQMDITQSTSAFWF